MQKLRVESFSISIDGFGAGVEQSIDNPLGKGGESLHSWLLPTDTFQKMIGNTSGETGMDNDFAKRGFDNIGAWIMGRNMFGPIRNDWPDGEWRGWWGDNPPYHCPVYVLTHYPRDPVEMDGGTTFHFVTEGIEVALEKAKIAANGKDIRLGGGVSTLRQFLQASLIDRMHIATSPIILGSGERLLEGVNLLELGYQVENYAFSEKAMHCVFSRGDSTA